MRKLLVFLSLMGLAALALMSQTPTTVSAATGSADTKSSESDEDVEAYLTAIMEELQLDELDSYVQEELPQQLTFSDMVTQIMEEGTDSLDMETIGTWVFDLFFYELAEAKPMFLQMLVFSIFFVGLNRFFVNGKRYASDLSFFVMYGALMLLLMQSFLVVGEIVENGITELCEFLTTLVPVYATTLIFSGNAVSASAYYEITFGLICLLEWAMKLFLVPGIHIFVLLILLDHVFEEEKFTRFAELLESGIRLLLKVAVGGVIGFGVVQSLLTPARDRISQSTVLKSMTILPGMGNSFQLAEEVILGCGMLVKNSVGVAGVILILVISVVPVIKVFCFYFLYRVLGAVLQPIADKRVSNSILGVARGCDLYLKIMIDTMLLFLITITMVAASTSFVY